MAAPVNLEPPVISGNPIVSGTLTVSNGVWDVVPDSFAYQWFNGGVEIAGAEDQDYVLAAGDVGGSITAEVTATNVDGSTPALSSPVGPVLQNPPFNTVPPAITGNAVVGQELTVSNGEWDNDPTSFEYQWYTGTEIIVDATDPTYIVVPDNVGFQLVCLVRAINSGGEDVAISNWTAAVTWPPLTPQQQYALFLARYSYPRPGPVWTG